MNKIALERLSDEELLLYAKEGLFEEARQEYEKNCTVRMKACVRAKAIKELYSYRNELLDHDKAYVTQHAKVYFAMLSYFDALTTFNDWGCDVLSLSDFETLFYTNRLLYRLAERHEGRFGRNLEYILSNLERPHKYAVKIQSKDKFEAHIRGQLDAYREDFFNQPAAYTLDNAKSYFARADVAHQLLNAKDILGRDLQRREISILAGLVHPLFVCYRQDDERLAGKIREFLDDARKAQE